MFCGCVWIGSLTVVRVDEPRSYGGYQLYGSIFVENQSYNKAVGILWESGGAWHNLAASYTSSLLTQGGRRIEVWSCNGRVHPAAVPSDIRYAAYYHNLDKGTSCWDNNGGADYLIHVI